MSGHDTTVGMRRLNECILDAQDRFAALLSSYLKNGSTSVEQYARYLSFQYHLTKGVQRYFLSIAGHSDLARRRRLREFLYTFANEEELHYLVAANDLHKLGLSPSPIPLDVELWHSYFGAIVETRPFVRLGAATVLENISDGTAKVWVKKALEGPYLNKQNTKFLVLHQHEALPHGIQILDAIENGDLEERHFDDMVEGARKGAVLYLRMAEWAIYPDSLASIADTSSAEIEADEAERIQNFQMNELDAA